MKRVNIEFPTRPVRAARRGEARSGWNEWIEDEIDMRRLRSGRKLDKVRRSIANQANEAPR